MFRTRAEQIADELAAAGETVTPVTPAPRKAPALKAEKPAAKRGLVLGH